LISKSRHKKAIDRSSMKLLPPRFWSKVNKSAGCWLWTGGKSGHGYGRFRLTGKLQSPHRLTYMEAKGPIPGGLTIDHLCRNTLCVNPDHLEAVTMKENVLRGEGPTAKFARRTHCLDGHEFVRLKNGHRVCLVCKEKRNKIWLQENPAYLKTYHQTHRDKLIAQHKEYYKANREKMLAQNKVNYEKNKEKILARNSAYYYANKEKYLAQCKAYREKCKALKQE